MSNRPTFQQYFMALACVVSARATCARRAVGCVLVDFHGRIIATGYNGRQRGSHHCIDEGMQCLGWDAPSGMNLDACEALHAEQNAMLQCAEVMDIAACYVTTAPCVSCTKMLLNTACSKIFYLQDYPTSGLHLWNRPREAHQVGHDPQTTWSEWLDNAVKLIPNRRGTRL